MKGNFPSNFINEEVNDLAWLSVMTTIYQRGEIYMEFEFRYRLEEENLEFKNLNAYYKRVLESLLEVMEFTVEGEIIDVDGFKFINSDDIIKLH